MKHIKLMFLKIEKAIMMMINKERFKKLRIRKTLFVTAGFFIVYNWIVGVYDVLGWMQEDCLIIQEWKQVGSPENVEIKKFNQSNLLFFKRDLYIQYGFEGDFQEGINYYHEKLSDNGWNLIYSKNNQIKYEKNYFTGEKNKKLEWLIIYNKNKKWIDVKISFW